MVFPISQPLETVYPFLLPPILHPENETLLSVDYMNSEKDSKLEKSWHSVACFFRKTIVSQHENDPSSHSDQYHNPRLLAMFAQQS